MKITTTEIGRGAESAVCDYLRARGVEILQTNIRLGKGEIDILARDGEVVLIVEVRLRGPGSYGSAFESITKDKQRRIISAARILWRTRLSKMEGIDRVRFDVAAVTMVGAPTNYAIEYVKAAFTE